MLDLEWSAVFYAAGASLVLGAVWYYVLFGEAWEDLQPTVLVPPTPIGRMVVIAFILLLGAAAIVSVLLLRLGAEGWREGLEAGLLVGAGGGVVAIGLNSLFEYKPWKLFAINAGYFIVALGTIGAILGASN